MRVQQGHAKFFKFMDKRDHLSSADGPGRKERRNRVHSGASTPFPLQNRHWKCHNVSSDNFNLVKQPMFRKISPHTPPPLHRNAGWRQGPIGSAKFFCCDVLVVLFFFSDFKMRHERCWLQCGVASAAGAHSRSRVKQGLTQAKPGPGAHPLTSHANAPKP